jgi:hypothetical protein
VRDHYLSTKIRYKQISKRFLLTGKRIQPRAEAIIMDGTSYIEPMGYSWNELKGLMIELRDSRIRKLQER